MPDCEKYYVEKIQRPVREEATQMVKDNLDISILSVEEFRRWQEICEKVIWEPIVSEIPGGPEALEAIKANRPSQLPPEIYPGLGK